MGNSAAAPGQEGLEVTGSDLALCALLVSGALGIAVWSIRRWARRRQRELWNRLDIIRWRRLRSNARRGSR